MNKITWLCVLGLVIATLLPVSQQTADEAGLDTDVSSNVHDLNSRIRRHSDGTYTSDLSKTLDQDLAMEFLQRAIDGKLRYKSYDLPLSRSDTQWMHIMTQQRQESRRKSEQCNQKVILWMGDIWYPARPPVAAIDKMEADVLWNKPYLTLEDTF